MASYSRGWAWFLPAIVALALVAGVTSYEGGIANTVRCSGHQAAFLALNAAFAAFPSALWSAFTLLGDSTVIMLLLAPLLMARPQAWAAVLASVPAGGLSSLLIKHWAALPRPAAMLDHSLFSLIGPPLLTNSFPSGHSLTAFAVAAAVLATVASSRPGRNRLQVAAGLLLAVVVALSRIAVGAHWPLDLVTGAAVGWLAGLCGAELARRTGWWRWLFFGAGRRLASTGLIVAGAMLWLRQHGTSACAVELVAGLSGAGVGLWLLLVIGPSAQAPVETEKAQRPGSPDPYEE